MYAFKYQPDTDLCFNCLARGELFFAAPNELNDGSECKPNLILKGKRSIWERFSSYLLNTLFHFSNLSIGDAQRVFPDDQALCDFLMPRPNTKDYSLFRLPSDLILFFEKNAPKLHLDDRLANLIYQHVLNDIINGDLKYMCSFSKDPQNTLMWSHYANAGKGFCLVYHTNDLKLNFKSHLKLFHDNTQNNSGIIKLIRKNNGPINLQEISYTKTPLKYNGFFNLIPKFSYSEQEDYYDVPALISSDVQAKKEKTLGLVKSSSWGYEKELRCIIEPFSSLAPEHRLLKIDPINFVGIILGPRMSPANKVRAVNALSILSASFSKKELMVFSSEYTSNSFDISFNPLGFVAGTPPLFIRNIPLINEYKNLNKQEQNIINKVLDEIQKS